MEILLLPISIIVSGYVIARLSGIDFAAIVEDLKLVVGMLLLVIPLLGLALALYFSAITPDELHDHTTSLIQSGIGLIVDHLTSVAIGAAVAPIALLLIDVLVRPIMDALDL